MECVSSGGSSRATVNGYQPPKTMLSIWSGSAFIHLNHQKPAEPSRGFNLTLRTKTHSAVLHGDCYAYTHHAIQFTEETIHKLHIQDT